MVNNSSKDITITALMDEGINALEILGEFQYDNQQYLAVKLCEKKSNFTNHPKQNSSNLTELGRFDLNGCICAIYRNDSGQEHNDINLAHVLTARELQIATLVAMGCPNKQVADKLHISEWTVATYLRRIFAKLGVETRAAMTYRCASLICKHDELNNNTK